ncbi:MAG: hypothetical protein Q7R70_03630 [Candidatus Diapherotrites archaeon]|nr:hypothetical protein [Candidatus Diapherotrites archaeon]
MNDKACEKFANFNINFALILAGPMLDFVMDAGVKMSEGIGTAVAGIGPDSEKSKEKVKQTINEMKQELPDKRIQIIQDIQAGLLAQMPKAKEFLKKAPEDAIFEEGFQIIDNYNFTPLPKLYSSLDNKQLFAYIDLAKANDAKLGEMLEKLTEWIGRIYTKYPGLFPKKGKPQTAAKK